MLISLIHTEMERDQGSVCHFRFSCRSLLLYTCQSYFLTSPERVNVCTFRWQKVWEWIYIQRPFVKLLIDCWAFKSSTACKYAHVTQRKQHSHAWVGTKVRDISRCRGKQREGGVFFLPLTAARCLNEVCVCVYVTMAGRPKHGCTLQ